MDSSCVVPPTHNVPTSYKMSLSGERISFQHYLRKTDWMTQQSKEEPDMVRQESLLPLPLPRQTDLFIGVLWRAIAAKRWLPPVIQVSNWISDCVAHAFSHKSASFSYSRRHAQEIGNWDFHRLRGRYSKQSETDAIIACHLKRFITRKLINVK